MKLAVIALSTAAVIVSAPAVLASSNTPGHEMQKYGKKLGYRVSSSAPGHRVRADRSKTGSPQVLGNAPIETREDITKIGGGGGM